MTTRPRSHAPAATARTLATLGLWLSWLALPAAATPVDTADALADTVRLAAIPVPAIAQPGDTVTISLTVPVQGPAFNAYDAWLDYDTESLQFLPAANVATQEGPLMTGACAQRFHVFEADTLAGRLRISHSLMCNQRSVTGPGVVYRVKFRCRSVDADTPLSLLRATPYRTAFYLAGWELLPLVTTDASVRVGAGSSTGAPPSRPGELGVRVAPNPFNPCTTITVATDHGSAPSGFLTVDVLTVDGCRVRRLWDGPIPPGPWQGAWDGRDDHGRAVAAGIYLVAARLDGSSVGCARMALVR